VLQGKRKAKTSEPINSERKKKNKKKRANHKKIRKREDAGIGVGLERMKDEE
jgi:hypothetical protein